MLEDSEYGLKKWYRIALAFRAFVISFDVVLLVLFFYYRSLERHDLAAHFEWGVSYMFSFYIWSHGLDSWLAAQAKLTLDSYYGEASAREYEARRAERRSWADATDPSALDEKSAPVSTSIQSSLASARHSWAEATDPPALDEKSTPALTSTQSSLASARLAQNRASPVTPYINAPRKEEEQMAEFV